MTSTVEVPGLPFVVTASQPDVWRRDGGTVVADAPGGTDLYVDPVGVTGATSDGAAPAASLPDAPRLVGLPPDGDFRLGARVSVDLRSTFDAGVLLLWRDERTWAKLCLERSPAGEAMVVSVVTRGESDDANAFVAPDDPVWLRVSRVDHVYAFHASTDGDRWTLVRVFGLGPDVGGHRVGFEAQSPTGPGCTVRFDDVRFDRERLTDLRDGS
ncbi:DUF1349 domain-containing protein [Jannaschia sp. R86511]|uniref:DUF1349 domain-containing protein n=1 Tax=Jannaschia sp. R86511 TaxID=3093853 RepID=UPI0036D309C8